MISSVSQPASSSRPPGFQRVILARPATSASVVLHDARPAKYAAPTPLSVWRLIVIVIVEQAGRFGTLPQQVSCGTCNPGAWSPAGSSRCLDCGSGNYSAVAGASTCTLCPPATYAVGSKQTFCTACSAGRTARVGRSSCEVYAAAAVWLECLACCSSDLHCWPVHGQHRVRTVPRCVCVRIPSNFIPLRACLSSGVLLAWSWRSLHGTSLSFQPTTIPVAALPWRSVCWHYRPGRLSPVWSQLVL